ncbi:MAG: hypothetical protein Q8O64_00910 [Sideroxyarcus sp.]|nr:hypothetical protein [Sideroxyarcus sp.]
MTRTLSFVASLFATLPIFFVSLAHAESPTGWEVGVGFERYTWKETASTIAIEPKESGNRLAIHVGWTPLKYDGNPYFAYVGKIYGGTVNYDTATIGGAIPVSTTTNYVGMVNEVKGMLPIGVIELVTGLGYDFWSRSIADGITNTGTFVQGYTENWEILFTRFGIAANIFETVNFAVGIKYTLQNNESGWGISGHPGQSSSPYADVSFRVKPNLKLAAYLDTYNFQESKVTSSGIYQPKSKMTALGVKAIWNF